MARVAVFSKYFGFNVGGSEHSMIELMKNLEESGNEIIALVNEAPVNYKAENNSIQLPATWEVRRFKLPFDWVRFRFIESLLNNNALRNLADSLDDIDILYAYGPLAPSIINSFKRNTVYVVRDEYGLGWNKNYYAGLRSIIQYLYYAIEIPFRVLWLKKLHLAIKKSKLIANSQFIANELKARYPEKEIDIVQPVVNAADLRSKYLACDIKNKTKGIVAIGDNVLKGGDIVRSIARLMPEQEFYLFDRKYETARTQENITFMPWMPAGKAYSYAKVVIVPSRWHEAFGRVVIEAQLLGIPVIASGRGGLPEAMSDKDMIVNDYEDADEWVRVLNKVLSTIK